MYLILRKRNTYKKSLIAQASGFVPGAGIEPAQPQWSQDFKSCASTNSAIRTPNGSFYLYKNSGVNPPFTFERKTRLELATLTLARLCSTN